jgi:Tol biopolymer transport system component
MRTNFERTMRTYRTAAVAAAMVTAGLMAALSVVPGEAQATFPGENGRIAFASNRTTGEEVDNPTGDFEIFTMNPDGTGLVQLTNNTAFDFDPDWSADGQRIAFESDRDLFSDIFVMNADGTEQTNVTNNAAFDRAAAFSPDGERIAFDSNLSTGVDNPTGDLEIFTVNLDGTGLTQLTNNTARELHPDYAPNGKKIAFVSDRDFRPGVYTMNADGTEQIKRSRGAAVVFQFPSWSPGGKRIAFASDQGGPLDIHRMRADGSRQTRLTDNGAAVDSVPVFSPGGKKMAFQTNRDGNFEIYKMRADGKGQTNLTNDPAGDFTPDWQPLQKTRR